jgi:hypothetical protein
MKRLVVNLALLPFVLASVVLSIFIVGGAYWPYSGLIIDASTYPIVGDGVTDNGAYIQAMLARVSQAGGKIVFPCGVFKIDRNLTGTVPAEGHVDISGGGSDCTELFFSGGPYGLTETWASIFGSFSASSLTFSTDQVNGGTGLSLVEPFASSFQVNEFGNNNIYDVTFRGHDRFTNATPTEYWATGFYESGLTLLNFYGGTCDNLPTSSLGICYSLNGPPPAVTGLQSVEINFFGTSTANCATGWFYGENVQGVTWTGINSTGCNYGITTTTSTSGPDQLTVTGSAMNVNVCGICINESSFGGAQISNNLIIVEPGATGVQLQGTGNFVVGNAISGTSTTGTIGVNINGPSANSGGNMIASNTIGGMSVGIQITISGTPAYAYAYLNNMEFNTNDYVLNDNGNALWATSTAYTSGTTVVNNNGVQVGLYTETVASCTSASSGLGPTGTGTGITDNTCSWNYAGIGAGGFFIQDVKARNLSTIMPCTSGNRFSSFLQADSNLTNGWGGVATSSGGGQAAHIVCAGSSYRNG